MKHPQDQGFSRAWLFAVALALIATGCQPSDQEAADSAAAGLEEALGPQAVSLVSPRARVEKPTLKLVGEVRAFESVPISTEVVGMIDEVLVEVGDRVRKGEALVKVDRETYRLRLNQAEANQAAARAELNIAAKELERKRDLLSDNTIPQAVFDQTEAGHQLAEARVDAAKASLDLAHRDYQRSVLRSPADATITARHVAAGQWADINDPLVELAVGTSVKVAAHVPDSWAPNLTGLEGFDYSVGTASSTYHAELHSIEPVISQASRSFEVVGTTPVVGTSLRPGMFAIIDLVSPASLRSLWLPASAVAISDMSQVLMVEHDAVVIRKVQTGRRNNGEIEIVSGLEENEQVIADVAGLGRGTPVTVTNPR